MSSSEPHTSAIESKSLYSTSHPALLSLGSLSGTSFLGFPVCFQLESVYRPVDSNFRRFGTRNARRTKRSTRATSWIVAICKSTRFRGRRRRTTSQRCTIVNPPKTHIGYRAARAACLSGSGMDRRAEIRRLLVYRRRILFMTLTRALANAQTITVSVLMNHAWSHLRSGSTAHFKKTLLTR